MCAVNTIRFAAALACAATLSVPARADELGRREFMSYCASCHGETAMGNGPIAEFLSVPPPNLTSLTADNDGEFPYLDIFMIIDGRTGVGPHGGEMPVWGDLFSAQELIAGTGYGAETIVRGRILSLVKYLEAIQQ
jgi:mono/diheme cytochrome c family protein